MLFALELSIEHRTLAMNRLVLLVAFLSLIALALATETAPHEKTSMDARRPISSVNHAIALNRPGRPCFPDL
jgi:hypothetical protein